MELESTPRVASHRNPRPFRPDLEGVGDIPHQTPKQIGFWGPLVLVFTVLGSLGCLPLVSSQLGCTEWVRQMMPVQLLSSQKGARQLLNQHTAPVQFPVRNSVRVFGHCTTCFLSEGCSCSTFTHMVQKVALLLVGTSKYGC